MPEEGFRIASAYVEVVPDLSGFASKLQSELNAATAGDKGTVRVGVELDDAGAIAGLAGLTAGAEAAKAALNDTASAAAKLAAATAAVGATRGGGVGLLGRLRNFHLPLFGGALGNLGLPAFIAAASGIHLLTDAVVEFLGVIVPATIAFAAFGVAAAPNIQAIYTQLKNVNTVTQATGQNLYPLTGRFQAMADAVKPQVYQLFGDALLIAGHNTGTFTTLATTAGTVLDQLGARFVVAVTHGQGFSSFLARAGSDLYGVGTVIGNLGGILGNVFKAVPGYAEYLLQLAVAGTHVLEVFSSATLPVLKWGLAIHGAVFYAGLGVTALATVIPKALTGLSGLAERAAYAAAGSSLLGAAGQKAGTGLLGIATGAETAAGMPWGWILTAAAGLGVLVYWLASAKSATQQWSDEMQQALVNAPVQAALGVIVTDLTAVNIQIGQTTTSLQHLTDAGQKYVDVQVSSGRTPLAGSVRVLNNAYRDQEGRLQQLTAAQQQLISEGQLYNTRLADIGRTYGGVTAAQGLLVASGITTKQMLDQSATTWEEVKVQVAATVAGYRAMGQTGGALGNDLQVLNEQASQQYTAMAKLNQAWTTWTSNMTGTQTSLDTFLQAFPQLNKDWQSGKVSIDSLSQAGLTLNQAFETQIGNANSLISTWRTAGIANNMLVTGVKDAIAPMVRYARGSQEATAQLAGLAQEAGYNGPVSLQKLERWLGNTRGAMANLKSITNQATVQEALLTTSMQAQGNYIAGQLIGDINNAILAYNGVQKAAQNYGRQLAQFGPQSSQAKTALDTLNNSIIKSGIAANNSTNQIAAMIAKVDKIPLSKAITIVERGEGTFSISQLGTTRPSGLAGPYGGKPLAAGGPVTQGTGPTADDVLLRGSRGEWMINAKSSGKYGPKAMAAVNEGKALIAYAGGGPILTGNLGVLSGQAAVSFDQQVASRMTAAMESAMTAATIGQLAAAVQALAAAVRGGGGRQVNLNYYGTQHPTPEQQAEMRRDLGMALAGP